MNEKATPNSGYRFIFGQTLGNLIVCQNCDTGDVLQKWATHITEWEKLRGGKFWFFAKRAEDNYEDEIREAGREIREADGDIKYWKGKAMYDGEERRYG